jgi:hypothetical protein
MGKFLTNIEDIKNNIKWVDIFDLHIIGMPNEQKLNEAQGLTKYRHIFGGFSESVTNIGFGDNNDIFVTFSDWDKGKTLSLVDDEALSKGMRLVLGDRDGSLVAKYEFSGCKLVSKVPIIFGYDNNYIIKQTPHILVFKYSNIYKVI